MAGSEEADGSKPTKPQEAVEIPLAGTLSKEEASGAQPAGEHAAEPSKGEHADAVAAAAAAPASAEDTAQQAQEEVARDSGAEDVKTPSAAARGRGKKGKGGPSYRVHAMRSSACLRDM